MIADVFQKYTKNFTFQLFVIFYSNLPAKFAFSLIYRILFNSFYRLFC